jgi:flagellar hook-associated protein 3 FlgL
MRVGDRVRYDTGLNALRDTQRQVDRIQRQITSGTRLQSAGDDPTGAAAVTRIRDGLAELESYERNINDAEAYLGIGEIAVTSASNVLIRAQSLAAQALNAGLGPASRDGIALELEGIRDQLVSLANTDYLGRPVFGGYATSAVAVAGDGTVTFEGTTDGVQRRISSAEVMTANLNGEEVFGFDTAGDDIFAVLQRLADEVRAGDADAIRAESVKLNERTVTVQNMLGTLGSRIGRLESARTVAQDQKLSLDARRAAIEDVDLATAATELAAANQAYEATLLSIARIDSMSLLDFLR